jgi:4-oxalocrotonate tautomerase
MPFANIKVPQAALSRAQKAEIVHGITAHLVDYFSEAARPHTMVLIEEVPRRRLRSRRGGVRCPASLSRKRWLSIRHATFRLSSVPPLSGNVIETKPLLGLRTNSRKSGSALSFMT